MLNNHRRFLFIDKANHFRDKFFGVGFIHSELHRRDTLDNFNDGLTGQNGAFRNLANKVIFDLANLAALESRCACLGSFERFTTLQSVSIHFIRLFAFGDGVSQLGNE